MGKFLTAMKENGLLDTYYPDIDWFLDDHKFGDLWKKNGKNEMSRRIKQFPGVSNNKFGIETHEEIFFHQRGDYKSLKPPIVQYVKYNAIAEDWVRHIRNAIAHGNCLLIKKNGLFHLEILDYNKKNEQTAYMFIPVSFLHDTRKLYSEIEYRLRKKQLQNKAA